MDVTSLWIPATVGAAAAQTARNAMQGRLIEAIGTAGATQVRFLYGFPFALVFLAAVLGLAGEPLPSPGWDALAFALAGAVAQILATALMLTAMRGGSFALTITYTKTEPVQVALFGALVLADPVSPLAGLAILVASAGVILMSLRPQASKGPGPGGGLLPALLGIASGACFALSAVAFRGAILALPEGSFVVRSTSVLALTLGLQSLLLGAYLGLFDRESFLGSLRAWRSSAFAGFMGAFASFLWFLAFSLSTAANVRTLALVEVLFAQLVSRRLFAQAPSRREMAGMAFVVLGVATLLAAR